MKMIFLKKDMQSLSSLALKTAPGSTRCYPVPPQGGTVFGEMDDIPLPSGGLALRRTEN